MNHAVLLAASLSVLLAFAAACNSQGPGGGDSPAGGDAAGGDAGAEPGAEEPGAPAGDADFDLDALPDHPVVVMHTTKGDITIELDNVKAPVSTRNFLRYAQTGHYDGLLFHRVMPDFMIQGGGFTEALYDNPRARPRTTGSPIRNEAANGLRNLRGTIAMARTPAVDSATSQFFINVVDNAMLDHRGTAPRKYGYAVFGRVIDGMDVVDAIRKVPTKVWGNHQALPVEPVRILSVEPVGP